jgi:hypothetical protein
MSRVIQDSITDGSLVLWHDYRAGDFLDLSGNGNNGTPNATWWGRGGVHFDGSSSYVAVSDAASLDFTQNFTLCALVRTHDSEGALLTKWNTSGNQRSYGIIISSGTFRMALSSDGSNSETEQSSISVNDGATRLLAAVYHDDDTVDLYINGLLDVTRTFTTVTGGAYSGTANVRVGDEEGGTIGGFLQGVVSTTLAFNTALTATQMAQVYSELHEQGGPS